MPSPTVSAPAARRARATLCRDFDPSVRLAVRFLKPAIEQNLPPLEGSEAVRHVTHSG